MNEKESIDAVINCLTDHNLIHKKDYIFKHISDGCFNIRLCPHRYALIDVVYFYKNIPDIKIFKIQQKGEYINILIKVKLRGDFCD